MRIGFTSTTFRNIKDLSRIVYLAKSAHADCIEWGGDIHITNEEEARYARKICRERGLTVNSYGSYYTVGSGNREEWEKICRIAEALGASSVRVWLGKKGSAKTTEAEYRAMLADAEYICGTAASYGITVMPECHNGTYNDNTDAFLRFASDLNKNNFATYFQSRYLDLQYDFDRLERTLPYIKTVHISYSERMRMQVFGRRDTEYVNRLADKLISLGYDGTVLLEYTYFAAPKYFLKDMKRLRARLEGVK